MANVEYDKFIMLQGLDLYHYMEPLVCDPRTNVSTHILNRMLAELPAYDEYHLVYALMLGVDHFPEGFITHVPKYLASEHGSVCCTACNILDRLADEYITQDLIDSARGVALSRRVENMVAKMLVRLEDRLRRRGVNQSRRSGPQTRHKGL